MDVKNTHSVTKTEISIFGRQALDAERRRSPSLADKVLSVVTSFVISVLFGDAEPGKNRLILCHRQIKYRYILRP